MVDACSNCFMRSLIKVPRVVAAAAEAAAWFAAVDEAGPLADRKVALGRVVGGEGVGLEVRPLACFRFGGMSISQSA
jgi:hypothetical protein